MHTHCGVAVIGAGAISFATALRLRLAGRQVVPIDSQHLGRGFVCQPMQRGMRDAGTVEFGTTRVPDWRRAQMLVTLAGATLGIVANLIQRRTPSCELDAPCPERFDKPDYALETTA
ncbi:hypothetical protein DNK06_02040 [Pseudomonas daroniae]|uniref:FAD dependent oxidoreductase domain-containing protein n=1 Tax=Phytopseudomonas daroniae TaxID=2487519 RepID=A0A4Q9QRZ7_9GAMM|nr:hypothetical protein DNK06_02040 [Pseudomonas daroniae]TBU84885.1 hypothetical protein DNK31_04420 [Pseudomonas sp. FRB 228]TBU93822.1 hypothetical protein DNJ99_05650 [Pseudomonas daroniae]